VVFENRLHSVANLGGFSRLQGRFEVGNRSLVHTSKGGRGRLTVREDVAAEVGEQTPDSFGVELLRRLNLRGEELDALRRGGQETAPENTIPAIELAAELGADYIEIDIRTSKDGKFYLLHDGTLNRTTSGKGAFKDLAAADVEKLDAGAWFGKPYVGAKVPSFDEGLTAMGDKAFGYLDCKDIAPEALAKILRDRKLLDRSAVYSSLEFLRNLKQIEPEARAMPPLKSLADLEKVAVIQPYAVDASWAALSKDLIAKCHEKGILVFSDSLGLNESVPKYRQAMEWGIDLIQTDHPARVLRAVELHIAASR
jgi:glycerophosphoryl diester phosphodiesterase